MFAWLQHAARCVIASHTLTMRAELLDKEGVGVGNGQWDRPGTANVVDTETANIDIQ